MITELPSFLDIYPVAFHLRFVD